MAWNGSSQQPQPKTEGKTKVAKAPSPLKGVLALVVILIGGAAALFFLRGEKKPVNTAKKATSQKIAAVEPQKAKPVEAKPEKPKERPPQRVGELRDGYRLLPSGRLHRVLGVITTGVERVTIVDKTFDHGSDRMIAHLLMAEPGGTMVGDSESIMHGFNEAFEKSLKDKIEIAADDPADVKELKQAVLDARKELLDQMATGKTAEEVMIETRDQLRELTLYREDLEVEVLKHAEGTMTQKDYDELIEAANAMLEERGCTKIRMPKLVSDAIEMRVRQEEARIKALEEKAKALENKMKGEK